MAGFSEKKTFLCRIKRHKNTNVMKVMFTNEEKTAIASVLYNLANADFQNLKEEKECLALCLNELDFKAADFVPVPRNELPKQSYETLKHMTKEKKIAFSRMMTQVSRADADFGPREQKFVKEILEMCDVPFVHR